MSSCPLCPKILRDRGALNVHLCTHTKEKPYKCLTCSASFGRLDILTSHIKIVHDGIKTIKPKNFKCPECDYKCSVNAKLQRHLRTHSADELPFSCSVPDCNFSSKFKTSLTKHIQKVHNIGQLHECTEKGCNFKTTFASNLNRHLKVHSDEKPFVCKFPGCKYTCKAKFNLDCHTETVHTQENLLKCSNCDYRTIYKARLRRHEDEQHENIKRFHCQVPKCSFATNSNYYLQHHFDRKHEKKDISCTEPGCDFSCGTIELLQRHAKKHVSPILKCPADFCNFSTRLLRVLRLHVSRQHKDVKCIPSLLVPIKSDTQTGALDKLLCPFPKCEYQTEFQHRYDLHIKTHEEDKTRFVCKFCTSRFRFSAQLERHVQRHIGEKPYSCSLCDYATVNSGELRLHARRIHNIHVIPRGEENVRTCITCSVAFSGYTEFMLHSTTHLKTVVVLPRLAFHVL